MSSPAPARPVFQSPPSTVPTAPTRLRDAEWMIAAGVTVITIALWWRNGGFADAFAGGTAALLSVGRLSGLLAAVAALAGLYLSARPRRLEREFGLDRMLGWHRWVGMGTVALVAVHGLADTFGYAATAGVNPLSQLLTMMATTPWMTAAVVAGLLFGTIGLTSWRRIRRRMAYETWYLASIHRWAG